MIPRRLAPTLLESARLYPVVTLTGPRQSGKTTLCRALFSEHRYVSLETPDARAFAREDPRAFLQEHRDGVVIDEAQQVPTLFSWIQSEVDENPQPGRFVLTGSQHFGLSDQVAQTLAGRTAVHHLLPMTYDEVAQFADAPRSLNEVLFAGGYPRIFDRSIPPQRWLSDYVATWLQRDIRQVLQVNQLEAFDRFTRLLAGRTSAELNLSAVGADAGVSHNTIRSWCSLMETCFVVFRVNAWHGNLRKRLVKAPKLHFVDTGLACFLMGIRSPDELAHHPLRGALFESWVASERAKAAYNQGLSPRLSHLRASGGMEVDLLEESGMVVRAFESKSGQTVVPSHAEHLKALLAQWDDHATLEPYLVHGGDTRRTMHGVRALPWTELSTITCG